NLRSIAAAVVSAAALLGGCAPDHYQVTGKDDGDPGWHGTQSETASEVAFARGQKIFVTTYNDDTDDGKITYTANDRVGFPGASLLGWSYSRDRGKTWAYGGKVRPPKGIAALWGDPSWCLARTQTASTSLRLPSMSPRSRRADTTGGWTTAASPGPVWLGPT